MSVSSRVALAALRSAYAECKAASPVKKLKDILDQRANNSFSAIAEGGIHQSAANGSSVTFFRPEDSGGTSQQEMVECYIYLRELYDRSLAVLGGSPEDEAIESKMETYLRPVMGTINDWRMLQR